jgi:hypothetical protein
MTQASDIYQKWISKDGIQPEEDVDDVERVLRHFGFIIKPGKKHKFKITHERFKDMDLAKVGLTKEYVIPTKKGRWVVKPYIKVILRYIKELDRGTDEN